MTIPRTVQQFYSNSQALRTINGICHDVRGNCRGLKRSQPIDWDKESTPLPKRRRVRNIIAGKQYTIIILFLKLYLQKFECKVHV